MSDPDAHAPHEPPPAGHTPQPTAGPPLSVSDDRQWASFAHLGGILGLIPSLVIWLIFKDRGTFTGAEAKEALNFQITMAIVNVIGWVLAFVLIGLLINLAAWVVMVVFSVLGFLKAKDGLPYRYPFALRLIK